MPVSLHSKARTPGRAPLACPILALAFSLSHTPFFFFGFLVPHLPHMEIPRLGIEWEPQLPAYRQLYRI